MWLKLGKYPAKLFMSRVQEKERLKKEKDEAEAKFKHALVDGRKEQVRFP